MPRKGWNKVTHGVTMFTRNGKLPPGCTYIERQVQAFSDRVKKEVHSRRGELTLYDASVIQTASRHETVARLWSRWLAKEGESLKVMERLAITQAIARASAERDKCLVLLKLDREQKESIIDILYNRQDEHEKRADRGDVASVDQQPIDVPATPSD